MKKSLLLLLIVLLLTGCTITRMDDKSYEQVIDNILSLNIKLYNRVGKGYKYYAPRGIIRTNANTYNDVLKRNDTTYYLYVDVVSYFYKTKNNYKINKNAYFSKELSHGKKNGYVEILKKNGKLYVQMFYNYAKIEAYTDEKDLNQTVEDASYILSSVKFNDSLLSKMYSSGSLDAKEEVYKLFDNKETDGNFLEYIKEYDKYDGDDDTSVTPEEEIEVKETTTTKAQETTSSSE